MTNPASAAEVLTADAATSEPVEAFARLALWGKHINKGGPLFPLEVATPSQAQPASQPSQPCWLVLLMIVTFVSSVSGQTLRAANLQVGHESWTFKDGAPPDVICLAQTNDGFLWLCGGPNGLVRFDGTRFEPFSSPFGDRLLSANLYSLFVPRSGGLWVGYQFGGFSFLDNGRVTNYASEIGSVYGFAQGRDGIVYSLQVQAMQALQTILSFNGNAEGPAHLHWPGFQRSGVTRRLDPRALGKLPR